MDHNGVQVEIAFLLQLDHVKKRIHHNFWATVNIEQLVRLVLYNI